MTLRHRAGLHRVLCVTFNGRDRLRRAVEARRRNDVSTTPTDWLRATCLVGGVFVRWPGFVPDMCGGLRLSGEGELGGGWAVEDDAVGPFDEQGHTIGGHGEFQPVAMDESMVEPALCRVRDYAGLVGLCLVGGCGGVRCSA